MDFVPWCSPTTRDGRPVHRAPTHLGRVVDVLERILVEQVEMAFSVPPRHGKSTLLLYTIAWLLSIDPTKRILYVCANKTLAEKQTKKAKRYALRAGIEIGDTNRKDFWETREGGCVRSCGIDQPPIGEGFDLVIVDDPHLNRAEAESRVIRDKIVESFLDDFYTRQEPGAVGTSFIVVHTRWHEDDLIGSITRASEDKEVEPFKLINLPAINDKGEALAPDLWPVAKLKKWAATLGPYGWASLFMGSPKPRGGRLFGDAHLCEEVPSSGVYTIGIDLTGTARTRSDWNALVVLLREDGHPDKLPRYYVVDARHAQGRLTDFVSRDDKSIDAGFARTIHTVQQVYPGARTAMYAASNESKTLELLAGLADTPVYVEERPAIRDKWQRAQPFAMAWNAGRVYVPRQAPWASAFIGELCGFSGKHGDRDDFVDAGATAYDIGEEAGFGLGVAPPLDDATRSQFGLSGRRRRSLMT